MNGRLLVAYDNGSSYVTTLCEYLESLCRYSRWEVRYLHVTRGADFDFDLNEFDSVFHNYCARLDIDGYVSADYLGKLKSFQGVKLLSVQDEWDRPDKLRTAIRDLGFHVVLSCVTERTVERIYPPEMFPNTEIVPVLAGFVPEHLAERGKTAMPLEDRPIVIGYRGREVGAKYGRLGFMKFEIGRRMREICEARGIPHDIEWAAEKRIYGEGWYDFIASCRANLGTEGGSNVFDFDGTLDETLQRLSAERGGPLSHEEFRIYTDPVEAQYDTGQLTPRLLEAAALKTPLVLFPGRYSGLIAPDEHYIELGEDFSNVDAVLARLDDLPALAAMADRAYRRLVGAGEFGYRRFVEWIDELLARKAAGLRLKLRAPCGEGRRDEIGTDPAALASFCETPSAAPRHYVFCEYKRLARENIVLHQEVARLNEVYGAEIARLNQEIIRISGGLRHIIALARLARNTASRTVAVVVLAGDGLGRAVLADAVLRRGADRATLVQLAWVIAAKRRARRRGFPARPPGLAATISPPVLALHAGAESAAGQGPRAAISAHDVASALAKGQIEQCVLVIDPGIASQSFFLSARRYELPDLLAWLRQRPMRLIGLVCAPDDSPRPVVMQEASLGPAVTAATIASTRND